MMMAVLHHVTRATNCDICGIVLFVITYFAFF